MTERCGRELNLLMLSIILHQRAIPLTWQFLSRKGNSNLAQQQALIQTILPLLEDYKVTVLGDRKFCSIALAQWLKNKGLSMCLRLRRSEYIRSWGRVQSTATTTRFKTRNINVFLWSEYY